MKFKVQGDPKNSKNGSSQIIIDSLNYAAMKMGVYALYDASVTYSCIGEGFGLHRDATICVYEMPPPPYVVNQLEGKPVLGVSRDNLFFLSSVLPTHLCDYFLLGVDSKKWRNVYGQKTNPHLFRYLVFSESNSRGCLELTITAFCKQFANSTDTELYIRDRQATDEWRSRVLHMSKEHNVKIFYDNREFTSPEEQLEIAATADCCISLNRSSTFNMRALECLSMGIPSVSMSYSGMREYILDSVTGLSVDYDIVEYADRRVAELTSLGLRHYLFPRQSYNSGVTVPYWAEPRLESLMEKMVLARENKDLLNSISFGGRKMAETLTWERAVVNLSYCLDRLL